MALCQTWCTLPKHLVCLPKVRLLNQLSQVGVHSLACALESHYQLIIERGGQKAGTQGLLLLQ